jgi:ParB-like chromosome segregation protein Spo0J
MSEVVLDVRMLRLDEIRPNPLQPRGSFAKEEIEQLANTIKEVGLLQPITVRKKGRTYQIISGERRWRACQFAGLKEIPAIVKDVTDSQMMIESLIENVHRKDLEPLEKARGLAEVYRLMGFDPMHVRIRIHTISNKIRGYAHYKPNTPLTDEEKTIKGIADRIGLSHDYQYRLLSQLRLSPEEQKRVTELKLGYEKIASLSSVEEEEDRRKLIEIAPTLERAKVKTLAKIVKKAPRPVKDAVLEKEIEPEIAEEILKVEEPKIQEKALEIAKKGVYTREGFQTRLLQLTKPRVELPQESIDVQFFNKTMWNLERVGDFDFYTIGYEKKTIDQFLMLLKAKKIRTLVDARKNPVSQYKPEFSKENLEETLNKSGIKYIHYPKLGVPSQIRRKLGETGDYAWFFKQYDENVIPKLDEEVDLDTLNYPIAIMCVELDPTKCHRHRIALALEERGLRGIDL